jgi:DNA-binding FrmR family transcriptional regulator
MSHTQRHRKKILDRISRIQGQLSGVARALEEERECSSVLQTLAAARGAINSLFAGIVEDHVRQHVVDPELRPGTPQAEATHELIEVVRAYFK